MAEETRDARARRYEALAEQMRGMGEIDGPRPSAVADLMLQAFDEGRTLPAVLCRLCVEGVTREIGPNGHAFHTWGSDVTPVPCYATEPAWQVEAERWDREVAEFGHPITPDAPAHDVRDYLNDAFLAGRVAARTQPAWLPMSLAKKDGTRVLVLVKDAIEGRPDMELFCGLQFVARHPGVSPGLRRGQPGPEDFDPGWSFGAPVGMGGFPDEWLVGWMPLPEKAPQPVAAEPQGLFAGLLEVLAPGYPTPLSRFMGELPGGREYFLRVHWKNWAGQLHLTLVEGGAIEAALPCNRCAGHDQIDLRPGGEVSPCDPCVLPKGHDAHVSASGRRRDA